MSPRKRSPDRRIDEKDDMKPIERLMPSISYIVARSNPGDVIGCENDLPWKLRTDLKFFKSVTQGHVVIMGRKTLDSLGKPLPNRINIVLSSGGGKDTENLLWAKDKETALYLADFISIMNNNKQVIVIGGAQVYRLFKELFTMIYLTEVHHSFPCGDAYFKERFDLREWDLIQRQNFSASEFDQYDFSISVLKRKMKYIRHRNLSDFYVKGQFDRLKTDIGSFEDRFKKSALAEEEQIPLPMLVA